jgi:cytochrome oxidase assembly protein ShyY1
LYVRLLIVTFSPLTKDTNQPTDTKPKYQNHRKAEACGLHPATPLLQVLADPSTGAKGEAPSARPPAAPFPLAKKSDAVVKFSTMPEDHLGYAATWGLMAASTAYLAAKAVRRGRGGGGGSGMRVATAAGRQQQRQ